MAIRPKNFRAPRLESLGGFRGSALAGALVGGLLLAAIERWQPSLIEAARRPVESALANYLRPVRDGTQAGLRMIRRLTGLWSIDAEFADVERQLLHTRAQLEFTREQLRRLGRLSGLRQWQSPPELEYLLADVIGFSTEDLAAEWTINRGSLDGIEIGLPVVGRLGLAGVIRQVEDHSARVQALSDPISAVGGADTENRARGVIFGRGRGSPLEFLPENDLTPIRPGARLVTSGLGNSVYPKGIFIGTVRERSFNERGVECGLVEPAENFNALEEVLVIRRAAAIGGSRRDGLATFSLTMPTTATLLVAGPLPLTWPIPDPDKPTPKKETSVAAGPGPEPPVILTGEPPWLLAAPVQATETTSSTLAQPALPPPVSGGLIETLGRIPADSPVVNPAWFRDDGGDEPAP